MSLCSERVGKIRTVSPALYKSKVCIIQKFYNSFYFGQYTRVLLKSDRLSHHDPQMGTFTVLGSTDKPHVVRLFPTEYCSCPATKSCYHLLAVKISLGISVNTDMKKIKRSCHIAGCHYDCIVLNSTNEFSLTPPNLNCSTIAPTLILD